MKSLRYGEFGDLIEASKNSHSGTIAKEKGDEFSSHVEGIQAPMVKKALAAQKAEDEKNIQEQILSALDLARCKRGEKVDEIRSLRKREKKLLAELDALDASEKVGIETGDFRPLLVCIGVLATEKI